MKYSLFVLVLLSCVRLHSQHDGLKNDWPKSDTITGYHRDCSTCPAIADTVIYRLHASGLYQSSEGDLAYRSVSVDANGNRTARFISHVYGANNDDNIGGGIARMSDVVDLPTFKKISDEYWSDQSHIYHFTIMSDGGTIAVMDADVKSFSVFENSSYAADNEHVYYRGRLMEKVDRASFRTILILSKEGAKPFVYGADDNHYYRYDEILTDAEVKEIGLP